MHRLDCLSKQQHLVTAQLLAAFFGPGAQPAQERMGFRQPFASRALAFKQEGDGIEPKTINSSIDPKIEHIEHRLLNLGVVVVEIWLVPQEPMQVVLASHRIPVPIRFFEMAE